MANFGNPLQGNWPLLNFLLLVTRHTQIKLTRGTKMGTRDYRWRERKKSKKGAKKPATTIITPQVEVEVIKKGKKVAPPEE